MHKKRRLYYEKVWQKEWRETLITNHMFAIERLIVSNMVVANQF